jgi:hypothetical protein
MSLILSKEQQSDVETILKLRSGKLPPIPELARRVANFDHFYYYSDSLTTYNAQEAISKELTKEINALPDGPLKSALKLGMSGNLTLIDELYPHRLLMCFLNRSPHDERAFALSEVTDEEHALFIKYVCGVSEAIYDGLKTERGNIHPWLGIIYTPYAPDPKQLSGKRSVPEYLQLLINTYTSPIVHALFNKLPKQLHNLKLSDTVKLMSLKQLTDGSWQFTVTHSDQTFTFILFL